METRKMTVHEALSKIKIANSRIVSLIDNSYINVCKAGSDKINGVPLTEYSKELAGHYDKAMAVINETNAIKAALAKSNASTIINVAGHEMTVAEAIYMWRYGIDIKKNFLAELKDQYANACTMVERRNGRELDDRAEQFVSSIYGSKDKADPKDVEAMIKKFKEQNSWELVDPVRLADKIRDLETEITQFEESVDAAIQISNATTVIEFEI